MSMLEFKFWTDSSLGSAADKANYVLQRGLGGAMLWDLPQDDFSVSHSILISQLYFFQLGIKDLNHSKNHHQIRSSIFGKLETPKPN